MLSPSKTLGRYLSDLEIGSSCICAINLRALAWGILKLSVMLSVFMTLWPWIELMLESRDAYFVIRDWGYLDTCDPLLKQRDTHLSISIYVHVSGSMALTCIIFKKQNLIRSFSISSQLNSPSFNSPLKLLIQYSVFSLRSMLHQHSLRWFAVLLPYKKLSSLANLSSWSSLKNRCMWAT